MDRPLWQTLYAFYLLRESDERRSIVRRTERVDAGLMTAYAFNDPSGLKDERESATTALLAFDRGTVDEDTELDRLRARAIRMTAGIEQAFPEVLPSDDVTT